MFKLNKYYIKPYTDISIFLPFFGSIYYIYKELNLGKKLLKLVKIKHKRASNEH